MNVVEYSVRHPVTTLMVFLAVLMVGLFCLFQFSIDQLPDIEIPTLTVLTAYPGVAPEDVETKVTKILEDALAGIPDIKHITSTSAEGLSRIILAFEWQTDLDTRANDARDAIDKAKMRLPDDIDPPRVLKFNMADLPILILGVEAKENYPRLDKLLEDMVTDELKRIPGVAMAAVITSLRRQVAVHFDRERLMAHGLTPQDIVRAIAVENQDISAGNVKSGRTDYLVRIAGEFKDVEPMRNIVLAVRNGRPVRLGDVAEVRDDFAEPTEYVTINGQAGAVIIVRKQSGANTVAVARAVKKKLVELSKRLPPDVRIFPVMDNSEDIERLVRDLAQTLFQGALLAVVVVVLFLRRWRASLIIVLAIPYSILLALIAVFFLHYTINMMSLFGLIIVVGMVVDNAIVILDNITRHREEGERPDEGAIFGASEVALAVAASTLTTVCIFFPILFVKGVTKIFFSQFAVVASIALLASLFSALTLTPMLAAVLLAHERFGAGHANRFFEASEKLFLRLEEAYSKMLDWSLRHRKSVILIALLLFGSSLMLVPRLGTEFQPKEDRNIVRGYVYMPVGTRVEVTRDVMARVEEILREVVRREERIATFTRCGISYTGMAAVMGDEGSHVGSFSIRLVTRDKRTRSDQAIAAEIRRRIQSVAGEFDIDKFTVETTDPLAGLVLGGERTLTINVLGNDLEETDRLAAQIQEITQNTPGAVDIQVSREKARPELQVMVNRAKAAQLGLNVSGIGETVRTSFYGAEASKYRIRSDEYDIFVRARQSDRDKVTDVAAVPLRLPTGGLLRVGDVASVQHAFGPVRIDRKDQSRVVNVTGDVFGRSLGEVTSDIEAQIRRLSLPPGVEIRMGGQTEEMRESFFWLTLALAIGAILVYMVMAAQFESLRDPFVVMFSVPFAFTGVFWALWIRGYTINIVVFLGLLMLIGTVVNNAIVLVDYIGILRGRGQSMGEAVRNAGRTRLRPVLMTALTTIVALIPMAVKRGQGQEVWNPLGTTVIGGLLLSTLVTLILVPVLYSIFESRVSGSGETPASKVPSGVGSYSEVAR
ncbi:MAG: efflux RND transporter permease subunit [Kiritimatiellia bacterium]